MTDLPPPPRVDPRWIHPHHTADRESLTLRLPVEGRDGQVLRVGIGGLSWPDGFGLRTVGPDSLLELLAKWDTLVIRERGGAVHQFELMMTGKDIAALAEGIRDALARARARETPIWHAGEAPPPPEYDPDAVVDPRWIPAWAQGRLDDRLHVTFPSNELGNAYLRLRSHDIGWPVNGTMQSVPFSQVVEIRSRGESIEVVLDTGYVWSRKALMPDDLRINLVNALRAFVARHQGPETPPPDALVRLLDQD